MRFRNRSEAGHLLARTLHRYKDRPDVLVLALPRGGVPVAYEVATALNAPLDVFIVRKLGVPGHEELAMGVIASGGICTLNSSVIQQLNIPPAGNRRKGRARSGRTSSPRAVVPRRQAFTGYFGTDSDSC
jgi:predicted phosphoribosyltransferase